MQGWKGEPRRHSIARKKGHAAKMRKINYEKVDRIQAREMELQIENDSRVYHQRLEPTYKNLVNKKAQGVYDKDKANKQFYNVVTDWERQHRDDVGPANPDTRMYVAKEMREDFDQEAAYGNYDNMLYKKYQKQKQPYHR